MSTRSSRSGASVPTVATAFGELAPAHSFAVGDGPLRSCVALGASVPVVPADDLDAISRTTGGRRRGEAAPARLGVADRDDRLVGVPEPVHHTAGDRGARLGSAPGLITTSTQNGAR